MFLPSSSEPHCNAAETSSRRYAARAAERVAAPPRGPWSMLGHEHTEFHELVDLAADKLVTAQIVHAGVVEFKSALNPPRHPSWCRTSRTATANAMARPFLIRKDGPTPTIGGSGSPRCRATSGSSSRCGKRLHPSLLDRRSLRFARWT